MEWIDPIKRDDIAHEFDLGVIKPKDVKAVINGKSSRSAPGPDGITYGILKKLPCVHHILATLYNKLLSDPTPPSLWTHAKVILLHKKNSTDNPENFRMIALSSVFGKIFHQIIVSRLETYLRQNNLIDTSIQKGFMTGISGCVDHNVVVHELIRHAKASQRTAHFTWYDLQDAFGSVPHDLIATTLTRFHVPHTIRQYIINLYNSISGHVSTRSWNTESFRFRKGIFQGDPLSPMIFVMCINPLAEYLKSSESFGYKLNDCRYITTFFADDFCLITGNKKTHQRITNALSTYTTSMGLKLKPSKCKSLSISSGKLDTNTEFHVYGQSISTLGKSDDQFKFLGSLISTHNTDYLKEIFDKGLRNLDASLARPEYKLQIYVKYLLPSMRYHLTVNDLCQTRLKEIDALTNRYIKKWSGLAHPATLAVLHMPQCLDIPTVSDLYFECHSLAHAQIRSKSDTKVNKCLDSKIDREQKWTRKKSVVTVSEEIWETAKNEGTNEGKKKQVKHACKQRVSEYWHDHVKGLAVQGKMLELIAIESNNAHWKSFAFNLPDRVAKFMFNATCDTLNTNVNLNRWGKRTNDKCSKCGNRETLHHVLNHCPISLEQGRFTWRHNNLLRHFLEIVQSGLLKGENVLDDPQVYCDLNFSGKTKESGRSTIPVSCTQTDLIPDLCVVWSEERKLLIMELTVPFDLNIQKAHTYKCNKYASLVSDIERNNFTVTFLAIEIGSRGFISSENEGRLKKLLSLCGKPCTVKQLCRKLANLAIVSSFVIYKAKEEPTWECHVPLA